LRGFQRQTRMYRRWRIVDEFIQKGYTTSSSRDRKSAFEMAAEVSRGWLSTSTIIDG